MKNVAAGFSLRQHRRDAGFTNSLAFRRDSPAGKISLSTRLRGERVGVRGEIFPDEFVSFDNISYDNRR